MSLILVEFLGELFSALFLICMTPVTIQRWHQTNNNNKKMKEKKRGKKPTFFWDSRYAEKLIMTLPEFPAPWPTMPTSPYLTQHTQDTMAFGVQAFLPSACLLDPSSKPTWLRGYRILKGWPAMTPQRGCWSHEAAVWWCFPHPPSWAGWRSHCWRRSGGYRDTASSKWCSAGLPASRPKTPILR